MHEASLRFLGCLRVQFDELSVVDLNKRLGDLPIFTERKGLNEPELLIEQAGFFDIGHTERNVSNSCNLERDMQMSLRNLRKLDCSEKPDPLFRIPL